MTDTGRWDYWKELLQIVYDVVLKSLVYLYFQDVIYFRCRSLNRVEYSVLQISIERVIKVHLSECRSFGDACHQMVCSEGH